MGRKRTDLDIFDCSDVTWEIEPSKRRGEVRILLKAEEQFNLMKIYLSLLMMAEKIELELNIFEEAPGIH